MKYLEAWISDTKQQCLVHSILHCQPPCPIHAPSEHSMRAWPRHWRADRGIMERICRHGVGHPDPDDRAIRSGKDSGVHGCCGCCYTEHVEAKLLVPSKEK